MSYFKIDETDFSPYVNSLTISYLNNVAKQTNAAGDSVMDLISLKKTITAGIIAISDTVMQSIIELLESVSMLIYYRDPLTHDLEELSCMIDGYEVEYYTIQSSKVMYKEFKLTFKEL